MYRLAILVALFAVFAVGCGGGDSDSGGDDSNGAAAAVAGASDEAQAAEPKESDAKQKRDSKKAAHDADKKKAADDANDDAGEGDAEQASKDPHEAIEEALEKAPTGKRNGIIRAAAQAALLRFGMRLADLEVLDGGRKINVFITRASACNGAAKDEPNMLLLIQESAPIVKSARFEVAGTGQQFGYYVLNCKREKMPDGPGREVFEHTGVSGPYTSPKFEIKTKKWALEWENQGNSMACIVLAVGGKSEGEYFKPIGERKRGAGRSVYTGSGTFQLKIHGAALWSVRVKEIR